MTSPVDGSSSAQWLKIGPGGGTVGGNRLKEFQARRRKGRGVLSSAVAVERKRARGTKKNVKVAFMIAIVVGSRAVVGVVFSDLRIAK
ncbi:hypothetical protein BDZ91DRAFT_737421 [Kalaharituber pfeilii]|nr:hypothetical protein BDZ91DRAFT_737421 [Kalaharituber pfeilii]